VPAWKTLPTIIRAQGERASRRFIEFFTATIRNRNTRMAYARAVKRFFHWSLLSGGRINADDDVRLFGLLSTGESAG
jgi:hypothetical protein